MAGRGEAVGAPIERLARPVLAYADRLPVVAEDRGALVAQARVLLERFETDALRHGLPPQAVAAARGALALLLEDAGAANLALSGWQGAARSLGAIDSVALAEILRRGGPGLDPVRALIDDCLARIEARRQVLDRDLPAGWWGMVAVLVGAWIMVAVGWAFWVESTQGRALERIFQAELIAAGLDRDAVFPDLAARLDRVDLAARQVAAGMSEVRLRPWAGLTGRDAGRRAAATLAELRARHLPRVLGIAIGMALASEGEPAAAYDTVRAWSVLSGAMDWHPSWLAGWAEDRAAAQPVLTGLAPHVLALLTRPETKIPGPDAELLAQARDLAAEAPEPVRAYLELSRSPQAAALPAWSPLDAVPALGTIAERRSGRAIGTPLPGLYTAAGWDMAASRGAGLAVEAARRAAERLFSDPLLVANDSPDQVMALLQAATLDRWEAWLADLRLRSFDDRRRAVLVSGALAQPDSPLKALIAEVWRQAGGTDRTRPHPLQLAIAVRFGPEIQYVETGRIARIAARFAELNVALGAMDSDAADAQRRLLTAQGRVRSIEALRDAPPLIGRLVEDTFAESTAAEVSDLTNPVTRAWQTQVLPLCASALAGRFPFSEGPDADPAAVAALLGPGGGIDRFLGAHADLLDREAASWRWKPEARLAGLDPDSAVFLQHALAVGAALAPGARITAAALAERGRATLVLGGQGGPLGAAGENLLLDWPGPRAAEGISVDFSTPEGAARLEQPGPWGLLRLLSPLRLRERDGGLRFLIDLRIGGARLFLEMTFDRPANPLSTRQLARGLACPQVL
ncbi:ImcF-related family protein [Paracoccus sp. MC1862]|uniref:ImcF-related family protein n=1 Tax=Paracoccus sp. MC1862 TaxID=2760307 RepID=UPI0016007B9F|nr:ImcF-related family protein [Paracoccus sp. MC1862]MBB1499078.1 IcmF-related protein [Paracoccus sp. MC1862]QQO46079.1 IcmF-related protein [Paracoccus sp. MC1862]